MSMFNVHRDIAPLDTVILIYNDNNLEKMIKDYYLVKTISFRETTIGGGIHS